MNKYTYIRIYSKYILLYTHTHIVDNWGDFFHLSFSPRWARQVNEIWPVCTSELTWTHSLSQLQEYRFARYFLHTKAVGKYCRAIFHFFSFWPLLFFWAYFKGLLTCFLYLAWAGSYLLILVTTFPILLYSLCTFLSVHILSLEVVCLAVLT